MSAKHNASRVSIVMGSKSDVDTMRAAKEILTEFGVDSEFRVLSAHRTPIHVLEFIKEAERQGTQVFIAAAGLAAHLAGVIAAHTLLPVIGVPMAGGPLNGFDSLLSTVQMPKGTPVATVAVGSAGAANAALLAVRILALGNAELQKKLSDYQQRITAEVLAADEEIRKK